MGGIEMAGPAFFLFLRRATRGIMLSRRPQPFKVSFPVHLWDIIARGPRRTRDNQ